MTAKISPTIRSGIISPVDCRAPKAKASSVTLKVANPFNPAFEVPIKKVAVNASAQAINEGSNVVDRFKSGV